MHENSCISLQLCGINNMIPFSRAPITADPATCVHMSSCTPWCLCKGTHNYIFIILLRWCPKTIKNTLVSLTVALGDIFLDYHEQTRTVIYFVSIPQDSVCGTVQGMYDNPPLKIYPNKCTIFSNCSEQLFLKMAKSFHKRNYIFLTDISIYFVKTYLINRNLLVQSWELQAS